MDALSHRYEAFLDTQVDLGEAKNVLGGDVAEFLDGLSQKGNKMIRDEGGEPPQKPEKFANEKEELRWMFAMYEWQMANEVREDLRHTRQTPPEEYALMRYLRRQILDTLISRSGENPKLRGIDFANLRAHLSVQSGLPSLAIDIAEKPLDELIARVMKQIRHRILDEVAETIVRNEDSPLRRDLRKFAKEHWAEPALARSRQGRVSALRQYLNERLPKTPDHTVNELVRAGQVLEMGGFQLELQTVEKSRVVAKLLTVPDAPWVEHLQAGTILQFKPTGIDGLWSQGLRSQSPLFSLYWLPGTSSIELIPAVVAA